MLSMHFLYIEVKVKIKYNIFINISSRENTNLNIIEWIKNIISKTKINLHNNHFGLVNTNVDAKVAENIQNNANIGCIQDNSTKIIEPNFHIHVMHSINCNDSIKNALALGNEYAKMVGESVATLLSNNGISETQIQEKLSNPEILKAISKANEIAYVTNDTEKRKILSDLIYNKLTVDDNESSNILTLAIREIDILTINHIKALSFLFIIKSNYLKNYSVEELKAFQNKYLIKILDFGNSNVKNIGNFLSSTRTISDAHIGHGIASYLPQILTNKDENVKTIDKEFEQLSNIWNILGFTGSYITPIGECIAQRYLFDTYSLFVEK